MSRDLDGWIKAHRWGGGHLVATLFAGFQSWRWRSPHWTVQRDFLRRWSTNRRIRHTHGAGSDAQDVLLMVFRSAAMSVAGGVLTGVV